MGEGKRVSWVELYLDLVFVLAVGQLAHLIVAEPAMRSVWIALGLFFTLCGRGSASRCSTTAHPPTSPSSGCC